MESKQSPLTAYFIPYLAPSHVVSLFQIAKLFASRGVHVTFITTPHNSVPFRDSVGSLNELGLKIELEYVEFPSKEVGLPEGIENFSSASNLEMAGKVYKAFFMLQGPIEAKVRAAKPDCIVADMHFYWATQLSDELGVPRFIYHARAYFALAAAEAINSHAPHKNVKSDEESFLIPGLPHEIHMTRSELPQWIQTEGPYTIFANKVAESDRNCYGALFYSFSALEKDYIDHYRNTLGRRSWSLGPFSPHINNILNKVNKQAQENKIRHPCLDWLDIMPEGKVVYISFGTLARFSSAQLFEIASALEDSEQPFVWVVHTKAEEKEKEGGKWLPDGFEERISEKGVGVLIKGWAPQVEILEHPAVGGVVTHCGWNSLMEAITAGLPIVAWPLSSEQFYHRKLAVEVLKIGVSVGNMKWSNMIGGIDELVGRERLESAVRELMAEDEEAEARRRRARELGLAAKKAVGEDGSSCDELSAVINEIQLLKDQKSKIVPC